MEHHERLDLLSLKITVELLNSKRFKMAVKDFRMSCAYYSVEQFMLLGNY